MSISMEKGFPNSKEMFEVDSIPSAAEKKQRTHLNSQILTITKLKLGKVLEDTKRLLPTRK